MAAIEGVGSLLGRALLGRGLPLGLRLRAIHYLLTKNCSVFFAFFCQFLSALLSQSGIVFALKLCNVSSLLGVGVVSLRDLLASLLKHPVVLVVVVVPSLVHEILEDLAHVVIVGAFLKLEVAAVLQVLVEFLWKTAGQRLDCRGNLLVLDAVVLVVLGLALEALPREAALQEVDQNETNTFEVVSARLLDPQVGVDTCVASSTGERLVILVGDVLSGLGISVALSQPEVDDVDNVLLLAVADEEVVGLHIAVDKVVIVQKLEPLNHLVSKHQGGLNSELALAVVEQILETRPEEVHDHGVVVALYAEPVDGRNSGSSVENFVDLGFVEQLGKLCLDGL
mmetsp:Transcript_17046/g.26332  ORF Transcript_17046/g.26332 Transcript_17046/m.26332 type:complete len:339 (-) Transcript_17046:210-1226(-)